MHGGRSERRGARALLRPRVFVSVGALAVLGGLLALGVHNGTCEQKLSSWVSLTTTGITDGALYAMIALGYTMVYGVLQLLNFAHSEVFMIGTFAGLYTVSKVFGITNANDPLGVGGVELVVVVAVAIVFAAVASGVTAIVMERVAYRPLRRAGASRLGYLITAIGVSLFLSNLFLLLDGGKHLGLPFTWPNIAGPSPVVFHSWRAMRPISGSPVIDGR